MIHLIYIYFILNALIAGSASNWKLLVRDFLIGLPYYGIGILCSWVVYWGQRAELVSLYDLYFTDKYSNKDWELVLKKIYPRSSAYRKGVIRLIAKKYGYKLI